MVCWREVNFFYIYSDYDSFLGEKLLIFFLKGYDNKKFLYFNNDGYVGETDIGVFSDIFDVFSEFY